MKTQAKNGHYEQASFLKVQIHTLENVAMKSTFWKKIAVIFHHFDEESKKKMEKNEDI